MLVPLVGPQEPEVDQGPAVVVDTDGGQAGRGRLSQGALVPLVGVGPQVPPVVVVGRLVDRWRQPSMKCK